MSSSFTILQILWRYKQREELSQEELADLRLWLMESPRNEELFDELSNSAKWDNEIAKWKTKDSNATWNKIRQRVEEISPEVFSKKKERARYLVAASVIFVLLISGLYFWLNKKQNGKELIASPQSGFRDILPATGTPILMLDNGRIVSLDSLARGPYARQGNTDIIKTDSADISYLNKTAESGELRYNTLTTPKGNQYHLVLSDGTNIWLNTASSIRFPVSFAGATREVELNGEAYFEVARNRSKPFIVKTDRSIAIRVLGTHFNVNAYPDEPVISTTLLEGSISIGNGKDSAIIKPGEEIGLNNQGQFNITPANPEQAVAWKSKLFWFRKASFEEIMRQLSRWYVMDLKYEGEIKQTYTGILPVNLPLSNVLHILEKSGSVHFTIEEGNKVTVRP